jgi:hypothetical protein
MSLLFDNCFVFYGGLLWEQVSRWSFFVANGLSIVSPFFMSKTLP